MLVNIKRKELEVLDDLSLLWTCIEPTIQQIRGKNFSVKSEAYARLTAGQRSLLMFQVLYGHSYNGVAEFFSHLSYLLSKESVWEELKKGMQYFGDYSMVNILEMMETVYHRIQANSEAELELLEQKNELDLLYREVIPETIKLIGSFIRNHHNEFVVIED